MKKIMSVFGTRPEAIKMCPVIAELKKRSGIKCVVCVTGQHRELLKSTPEIFGIVPDYNLPVMKEGQTLTELTCDILMRLNSVLEAERPDVVLVHGDTTTAFSAALACFYRQIPVYHIEAGLRTYRLDMPYPEEFNRQCVGLVAKYHFAPTKEAERNLIAEGKSRDSVFVSGNTIVDALNMTIREDYYHPLLDWVGSGRLLILTLHRRENVGMPMQRVFGAVRRIVERYSDIFAIYPVHSNPTIGEAARKAFCGIDRIKVIEPLEVTDFHNIMYRAYIIITDSGGVQEEALHLGKRTVIVRDVTERPESLFSDMVRVSGTDEDAVCEAFGELFTKETTAEKTPANPYGEGRASVYIADIIERDLFSL